MTDLKSMTPEELTAWCREQGQPGLSRQAAVSNGSAGGWFLPRR